MKLNLRKAIMKRLKFLNKFIKEKSEVSRRAYAKKTYYSVNLLKKTEK